MKITATFEIVPVSDEEFANGSIPALVEYLQGAVAGGLHFCGIEAKNIVIKIDDGIQTNDRTADIATEYKKG